MTTTSCCPTRRAARRRPSGFTLVELLLAVTIGSLLVVGLADSMLVFGASMTELRDDPEAELEEAVANMSHQVRTSWVAERVSATELLLTDALGRQTTYFLSGSDLKVKQPTGATGVLVGGVSALGFDVETVRRLRDDTPTTITDAWDQVLIPSGSPTLSTFEVAEHEHVKQLALRVDPSANEPSGIHTIAGVTEQLISAELGNLVLTVADLDIQDVYNTIPQPCNHEHCHYGETCSHFYCHDPGDHSDACWKAGHSHPDSCGVYGDGDGEIIGTSVCVPGGGDTVIDLYVPLEHEHAIPDEVSAGSLLAQTRMLKGVAPDGGPWVLTECVGISPYYPPTLPVTIDLSGLASYVLEQGETYSLKFRQDLGSNALAVLRFPTATANARVGARSGSSGWAEPFFGVPFTLTGSRTYTQTRELQVVSSVTITVTLTSGASITSSASVVSQAGVSDPWLGAAPGELPTLLTP